MSQDGWTGRKQPLTAGTATKVRPARSPRIGRTYGMSGASDPC
ncbi:MAG: hypothetical protein QG597_1408 [Actinomycetota bacterium]|nr:hypothetical protein [Actinomycetota bacterium]